MQLHQSMPYSCLSEVKLIWGAFFNFFGVFTMCYLRHVILSDLMGVQFKGWQLGLVRDHMFLRAWCAQILPAMQSLVCFLLKIYCKHRPVCALVFCAFQCTYWKFCQNCVSQSAANLNKQIYMFTWNKQLWHLLMCFIWTSIKLMNAKYLHRWLLSLFFAIYPIVLITCVILLHSSTV